MNHQASDQAIMDMLEEVYGESAAEQFGDCLDHFRNTFDEDAMVDTVNATLKQIGTSLRVSHIVEVLDDEYVWGIADPDVDPPKVADEPEIAEELE